MVIVGFFGFLSYTSSMHIAYCAALRLPSERAYGHQVAAVCQALLKLGHEIEVLVPERVNPITEDFWSYYGADRKIALHQLRAFDGIASRWTPGLLGLHLHTRSFRRQLHEYLRMHKYELLYTRTPALLGTLLSSGQPVMIELHTLPRLGRRRFVQQCNQCVRVICLTTPMKDELQRWGVQQNKLTVEGDAVDVAAFENLPLPAAVREQWNIPADSSVIGYAGSLATMGLSKGVDQIVEAVLSLDASVRALIAGGPPEAAHALRGLVAVHGGEKRVEVLGPVSREDVKSVYAASDILVYPAPTSDAVYFRRDTSPLKVFEYMAARRPIIAAAIPPIRDILDETVALLYQPGDVRHLQNQIAYALAHPDDMQRMADRAYDRVKDHTWTKRMQRILSVS